jgi:hypothetical protein
MTVRNSFRIFFGNLLSLAAFSSMSRISAHTRFVVLAAIAVMALASSAPGAPRPGEPPVDPLLEMKQQAKTAAEQLYPDAPDGVDPVVTGPVSRQFRERQAAARCDEATWPNIPLDCYP